MSDETPQFPAYADFATENWLSLLRQTNQLAQVLAARNSVGYPPQQKQECEIDYVQRCYEELTYAYTIESAIFWHCEIINELSLIVHATHAQPWPEDAKRSFIEALEGRIAEHCQHLSTLTGVLQRQERFVWRCPYPNRTRGETRQTKHGPG